MGKTIPCGTYDVQHAVLDGSKFTNVGLAQAKCDDVSLQAAEFENVNLSESSFNNANLSQSTFNDINFTNARLTKCNLAGMTIDGVPVAEALTAYRVKRLAELSGTEKKLRPIRRRR